MRGLVQPSKEGPQGDHLPAQAVLALADLSDPLRPSSTRVAGPEVEGTARERVEQPARPAPFPEKQTTGSRMKHALARKLASERDEDIALQRDFEAEQRRIRAARIRKVHKDNPELNLDELAERFGCTERMIRHAIAGEP
jgi:hypothetical protein